ncbi:MAG: PLP-dependent aminotransferase family protein [Acidobacteria bacterium]|nr:PLP-dependent aminotransferase family protein [Acidobacteriota bacterium]
MNRLTPDVPEHAISFVAARPPEDLFPVEEFRNCCSAVLKEDGRRILQFGCSEGYAPLKRVLMDLLRKEGVVAAEDEILITDGCQQALDLLCKAFLRPGDAVALENPNYPGAIALLSNARVRMLGVPVQMGAGGADTGMDVGALETVLLQNRVKMILVTPDFQNPTGTTMPLNARRKLLEVAGRHQVPVIEDHIYGGLWVRGKKVPSLKALDRHGIVIQADSFSKVSFPGLRVGWCVAPRSVIERLRLVKQSADLHTDQLAQAALAEFTRRGYFEKHLVKMRKLYGNRLVAMEEALEKYMPEGVEWARTEGGMAVWLTLPPGFDATELLIHVRERGVWFAPGRYFYFQYPQPNTLRLAFAALDEKKIAKGVSTLGEVLRIEMRKRERGARREYRGATALV